MSDKKKQDMMHGLNVLVENHIEKTPHLRRMRAVMRALAMEMKKISVSGENLLPLAVTADENGRVSFLARDPSMTRDDIIARLKTHARQDGILSAGFCTVEYESSPDAQAVLHIHAEDRMKPGFALLAISRLREDSGKEGKPWGGVRKKVPPLIFGPMN